MQTCSAVERHADARYRFVSARDHQLFGQPKDPISAPLQLTVARQIRGVSLGVVAAVDLHDEPGLAGVEIHDDAAQRHLAPKRDPLIMGHVYGGIGGELLPPNTWARCAAWVAIVANSRASAGSFL